MKQEQIQGVHEFVLEYIEFVAAKGHSHNNIWWLIGTQEMSQWKMQIWENNRCGGVLGNR